MKASLRGTTWVLLVITTGACAKKMYGEQAAAPPSDAAAEDFAGADGAEQERDVEAWERELVRLEAELRASGVTLSADASGERDDAALRDERERAQEVSDGDPAAQCGRICDLAEATCELHEKICTLADEHEGEQRYVAACTRADDDCRRASEACRACSA
jgi:hypothetical protein